MMPEAFGADVYQTEARVPPPVDTPLPPGRSERKPLGLRPVGEPEPSYEAAFVSGPSIPSVLATLSPEARSAPASLGDVAEALDTAVAIDFDGDGLLRARIGELRREIARLEVENAKLLASVAEVRSKLHEVSFVQERLQIERRGPPGVAGPRGADGPAGMRGERGERGEAGPPEPTIAAWEPRPERFEVVPVFSDGSRGPAIALLSLFQAYDSAVQELDDRDLTEAAQASREAAEDAAEASRWAMR
jgi:hypothetical protein